MKQIKELLKVEERSKNLFKQLQTKNESIYFDYTKTHLEKCYFEEIAQILTEREIFKKIKDMFEGEKINYTEDKKVLHTLLRNKVVLDCVEFNVSQYREKNTNIFQKISTLKDLIKESLEGKNMEEKMKIEREYERKRKFLDEKEKRKTCEHSNCESETIKFLDKEYQFNFCDVKDKISREICIELFKMFLLDEEFENKKLIGATGKKIDTIVHIGIGGSYLGPRLVSEALFHYKNKPATLKFVSNIDPEEAKTVFNQIDPEKTLFVVVSKSFKTQETLFNAEILCAQYKKHFPKADFALFKKKQFVAISANKKEANKFGCEMVLDMGDYVGGRYSVWSTAALSVLISIGFDNFVQFLRGAQTVDEHFLKTEDLQKNIPIMHAIIELFYNKAGYNNKAILAYDCLLESLYKYLQQAEMESNGKSARKQAVGGKNSSKLQNDLRLNMGKSAHENQVESEPVCDKEYIKNTGMIVWGDTGTNCQHSFFQLIHQGTRKILSEFIVGLNPSDTCCKLVKKHHNLLFANCIAQSEALMLGKKNDNLDRNFEGDKPSITVMYSRLVPETIGALLAVYEHKIFVQGIFWKINSFDQFGVELGKELANVVFDELENGNKNKHDESTQNLISIKRKNNEDREKKIKK